MAIVHTDLGVDEDLGRRILVRARAIAPCLDSLAGEARKDAIAILKGVVDELPATGYARAKSLSRDGTSLTFSDIGSAFTADDIAGLRALCAAAAPGGLPIGSFPDSRIASKVWPEERYS